MLVFSLIFNLFSVPSLNLIARFPIEFKVATCIPTRSFGSFLVELKISQMATKHKKHCNIGDDRCVG